MIILLAFVGIKYLELPIDLLAQNIDEELNNLLEWFEDNLLYR